MDVEKGVRACLDAVLSNRNQGGREGKEGAERKKGRFLEMALWQR